jgi:transposase|tara:strand:- start:269 stop:1576 length:1308 start_codon:yes stop_codon:yes gene_type:complete
MFLVIYQIVAAANQILKGEYMINTIKVKRNAKMIGINMSTLREPYNVWRNTCTKLSAWMNDAIKNHNLDLKSYGPGYKFDYKIDKKYWSKKRNRDKVANDQCASAELGKYLSVETDVFCECSPKTSSQRRDVINYVAERYNGYFKRNGRKKIPHPTFHEDIAWYFKEQFSTIDAKKKTLKIKTLKGCVDTTYKYGLKDELLHGKARGGNLRIKTKEFIAAVEFNNDVLYQPEGVIGFDINFQKGCWLTMNDGTEIPMSDELHELVQKQKELNTKIADRTKPVKERKIKSKERKRLRILKNKTTKQMDKIIRSVADKILDDAIENKYLLAIDGMAPQGSWGQDKLIAYLQTRCENKGVPFYIVPSPYTSRICSVCGFESKKNRKKTDEFKCQECGFECSAHFNAAVNIANKAQSFLDDEMPYGKPPRFIKQKTVTV